MKLGYCESASTSSICSRVTPLAHSFMIITDCASSGSIRWICQSWQETHPCQCFGFRSSLLDNSTAEHKDESRAARDKETCTELGTSDKARYPITFDDWRLAFKLFLERGMKAARLDVTGRRDVDLLIRDFHALFLGEKERNRKMSLAQETLEPKVAQMMHTLGDNFRLEERTIVLDIGNKRFP